MNGKFKKFKLVDQEGDLGPPKLGVPGARREVLLPDIKYSFEKCPPNVPKTNIKEIFTAEVVVAGGGISGMTAALSAAENGAKVVLIEMMGTFVAHGGDIAAIGSRLQKKLGIKIDIDEVVLNLVKYGNNKPDQRLIRMWANGSGEAMDWLLDMYDPEGTKVYVNQYPPPPGWSNVSQYYPQYFVTHKFKEMMAVKCIMEHAIKRGVIIHFRTRAMQLIRNRHGRITGLVAKDRNGNYKQYNARKGVILCTGDYGHNPEMMAKYCPQNPHLLTRHITSTGDGHMMGIWVGGVIEPGPHALIMHQGAGPLGTDAFLQVNFLGERFQNEDVPGQSYANQIERQPGGNGWQVYDSKYPEELRLMGVGHGVINGYTDDNVFRGEGPLVAGTLEELANKMGVPKATFLATIARYNELARLGKDLDFGKRPDRLTTIEKPPFYAGTGARGGFLAIMGGLNASTRCQVLDKEWKPIPGLYVAGNTMGNRFAVDYPTMLPGICNSMALFFGRVAGRDAALI